MRYDNLIKYTTVYFKAVKAGLLITNNKLYTFYTEESITVKSPLDIDYCADKVGSFMGCPFFLLRCKKHWEIELTKV